MSFDLGSLQRVLLCAISSGLYEWLGMGQLSLSVALSGVDIVFTPGLLYDGGSGLYLQLVTG